MSTEDPAITEAGRGPLTLPATFSNSFWTSDYRRGVETALKKLENGCTESEQAISLIRQRSQVERETSAALQLSQLSQGFASDDGSQATLQRAFEGIRAHESNEKAVRRILADRLEQEIVLPFSNWSAGHTSRVQTSARVLVELLDKYENQLARVQSARVHYDSARTSAEVAEDEAEFDNIHEKLPHRPDESIDSEDEDLRLGGTGSLSRVLTKRAAGLGRALTVRLKETLATPITAGHAAVSPEIENREAPALPEKDEVNVEPLNNVNSALEWSRTRLNSLLIGGNGDSSEKETKEVTARRAAEIAEENYKKGIDRLDVIRTMLESNISSHLAYAQKIELDRIRALASVFKAYVGALAGLAPSLQSSLTSATATIELIKPENEISAMLEALKTGPFVPSVTSFVSHYAESPLRHFGIDLVRWQETSAPLNIPPLLSHLLDYLAQESIKNPSKASLAWILEAPLAAIHHLRSSINAITRLEEVDLARYDLPVLTGTVKLWFLELTPSPIGGSRYDEVKLLYPRSTGEAEEGVREKKLDAIAGVLARLPKAHYEVIKALVKHLFAVTSQSENTQEMVKLSLTLHRCIIRPDRYTSLNLNDRFPAPFFHDLLQDGTTIFQRVEAQRDISVTDATRYKPRRQRTRPIDSRRFRTSSEVGLPIAPEPKPSVEELSTKTESVGEGSTSGIEFASPSSTSTKPLLSTRTSPIASLPMIMTGSHEQPLGSPIAMGFAGAGPTEPPFVPPTAPISSADLTPAAPVNEAEASPLTPRAVLNRSKRISVKGPRSQRLSTGGASSGSSQKEMETKVEEDKSDAGEKFEDCD